MVRRVGRPRGASVASVARVRVSARVRALRDGGAAAERGTVRGRLRRRERRGDGVGVSATRAARRRRSPRVSSGAGPAVARRAHIRRRRRRPVVPRVSRHRRRVAQEGRGRHLAELPAQRRPRKERRERWFRHLFVRRQTLVRRLGARTLRLRKLRLRFEFVRPLGRLGGGGAVDVRARGVLVPRPAPRARGEHPRPPPLPRGARDARAHGRRARAVSGRGAVRVREDARRASTSPRRRVVVHEGRESSARLRRGGGRGGAGEKPLRSPLRVGFLGRPAALPHRHARAVPRARRARVRGRVRDAQRGGFALARGVAGGGGDGPRDARREGDGFARAGDGRPGGLPTEKRVQVQGEGAALRLAHARERREAGRLDRAPGRGDEDDARRGEARRRARDAGARRRVPTRRRQGGAKGGTIF